MPYRGFVEEVASPRQRRLCLIGCVAVLTSVTLALPYAAVQLPQLPHISGMYGAATAMIDLATFWLLISAPRPQRAHIVLAAAYLFAGLMAVLHVLTFPGAVFAEGPVIGSPHAVSWLFVGWRAGFALFVAWAALAEPRDDAGPDASSTFPLVLAVLGAAAMALGAQLTDAAAVTVVGGRSLFSHMSVVGSHVSAAAAAMAVVVIWRRGLLRRSIFVWLVFVLVAEGSGVWLSTFSGQRYSLAWYMTRIEGLLANSVLLALLAMHFRIVQKRLTDAVVALQRRTDELQAQVQRREAAETQLARAQKLHVVGRLGASLAHDLNNILQVLTGRLMIVERRAGPAVEQDVQVMRRSVRKAEALTRQLTLISGRRRNEPRVIAAAEVLEEIAEVLRSLVGTRCHLTITADDDLPPVALDPLELEIAVTNLVTNACDAMRGHGEVWVRASRAFTADGDPALMLTVQDNGEGIKPEILEKVFEPFFTTKLRGHGTGLGLAQVHGFVTGSGGTVDVRSRLGEGTTVTMRFPAALATPEREGAALAPAPRSVEGRVLLLVEDNPDVRESSVQLLGAEGLAVRAACDGDEALAVLASGFSPDYLVSDIVMSGSMDGVELVREVRRRFPAIKTVLVTGYSDVAERAREEGFPVLRKPYDLASLLAALA